MKKIKIDKNLCLGCGTCVSLSPKTFALGKDGKAQVIAQDDGTSKEVNEAIKSCPVQAISLEDQ